MSEQKSKTSIGDRSKLIAYWIFTGIVALETAAGAQWDLSRNQFVENIFTHLGYPSFLLTIIGVWKIPAFLVILAPRFGLVKEWAYAGLFFVYSGAAASHIAVGDNISAWGSPVLFSMMVIASWSLRPPSRRVIPIQISPREK